MWSISFSVSFFLFLDTCEVASVNLPIPVQTRNYYKNVSDNKEIVKLVSVLSTIITSTKKVRHEGSFLSGRCLREAEHLTLDLHVASVSLVPAVSGL